MARSPITLPERLKQHEAMVNEELAAVEEKYSPDAARLVLMRKLFKRVDQATAAELARESVKAEVASIVRQR